MIFEEIYFLRKEESQMSFKNGSFAVTCLFIVLLGLVGQGEVPAKPTTFAEVAF